MDGLWGTAMIFIVGAVIVLISVIGGYVGIGGHLAVLFQPYEVVIIFGAAAGSFVIGSPGPVLRATFHALPKLLRGQQYTRSSYIELLTMLYTVFRLAKAKGDLILESHVDRPHDSELFRKFPGFLADEIALKFFCDYLRLLTLGTSNAHQLDEVITEEIEAKHHEHLRVSNAITNMGDSMPALGIVAAVLGVIHTMASIAEPPEVLGHLIGAALVGTFLGVLLSYGFITPMARKLELVFEDESGYLQCIRVALISHMQGYAPAVSVELARKTLPTEVCPSFEVLEENLTAKS